MKIKMAMIFLIIISLVTCLPKNTKRLHFLLEVNTDDAIKAETNGAIFDLEARLKSPNISFAQIMSAPDKPGNFILSGFEPELEGQIRNLLDEHFPSWECSFDNNSLTGSLKKEAAKMIRETTVAQTIDTIRKRLKALGLRKAVVQKDALNGERVVVEFMARPIADPSRIKSILFYSGMFELKLVKAGPATDKETLLQDFGGQIPQSTEILREDPKRSDGSYYLVNSIAVVTGRDLKSARRSSDEWNNPAVAFSLNPVGAKRFELFTSENIGKALAIVFDGKIISAPIIQDKISGSGIIHGRFTVEEAEDMALILMAGALPSAVKLLEERTIE